MIQLHNVSLAFGGQQILDGLSWTITPNQRIGLIGPNGSGKSTLLRVLDGRLSPQDGHVATGKASIGYLEQDVQAAACGRTVREEGLQAFQDVLALEAREQEITDALAEADDYKSDYYEDLLHKLDSVQTRLTQRDAHRIGPWTDAVMTGLGFEPDELDRPLDTYSGGWQMRAALGRLLLRQPDVLLLDEPTNHLDIDSIDWLENYLKDYPGTVVIVSHDRYFLDRMVTRIAELTHGRLTEYKGSYSYYLEEREERRALQQAAYENQQRKINEIQAFIDRFRYNASKASQVQSRIKKLEKMDRVPPPPSEEGEININFPEPERSGRVVLEVSTFSKSYETEEGTLQVFDEAEPLAIERGDKVALIGKNGAGKSTLARILRGTEPFEGTREVGYKVNATFFAQHQAEALSPDKTILDVLRDRAPHKDESTLRSMAGAFLFSGEDVFKKVAVLSGGEKSRVALARLLLEPTNFLILDEPTNHLDIQSIDVLTQALQQYTGTFLVVSHDRRFLDEVADTVWRVGDGRVQTYPGSYSDYRWYVEQRTGTEASAAGGAKQNGASAESPATSSSSPDAGQGDATKYGHLNAYQLRQKYEKVEQAILEKEARQEDIEAELADPALYDDPDQARSTNRSYDALKDELADLYDEWETLADHLTVKE